MITRGYRYPLPATNIHYPGWWFPQRLYGKENLGYGYPLPASDIHYHFGKGYPPWMFIIHICYPGSITAKPQSQWLISHSIVGNWFSYIPVLAWLNIHLNGCCYLFNKQSPHCFRGMDVRIDQIRNWKTSFAFYCIYNVCRCTIFVLIILYTIGRIWNVPCEKTTLCQIYYMCLCLLMRINLQIRICLLKVVLSSIFIELFSIYLVTQSL